MIHVTFITERNMGDHAERLSEPIEFEPDMTVRELVAAVRVARGYPRSIEPTDVIEIRVTEDAP